MKSQSPGIRGKDIHSSYFCCHVLIREVFSILLMQLLKKESGLTKAEPWGSRLLQAGFVEK